MVLVFILDLLFYLSLFSVFMVPMVLLAYTLNLRNKTRWLKKRRMVKNKSIGNLETAVFLDNDQDNTVLTVNKIIR